MTSLLCLVASLWSPSKALAAEVLTPCFLKVSVFNDVEGIVVDDLFADPNFPDNPSETHYIASFNTREAFPDNSRDNYGTRIEGFITPQVSGSYTFFLSSDDGAELYVSSDDTEANARLIAEELDCCDPFQEPETDDLATSFPMDLQAGESYFIMVLHKEGSGGDYAEVAWRLEGDPTSAAELEPISGSFLSTLADDSHNPSITIVQDPGNSTGVENGSATFEVDFDASPGSPVCVQWQKNGVNIPNAIGNPITLDLLALGDNGAKIRAVIATPGLSVESAEATLTVTPDTTAPELLAAGNTPSKPEVVLTFSERMAEGSATRTGNYQINGSTGSLDILDASLSPDGTQVILVTSDPVIGTEYTIELNNLTDRAASANPLPSGTTASFFGVGKLLQGSDGFVVWEAEDFDLNLDGLWIPVTDRGEASGGRGMLIPNGVGGSEGATKLEYDINFTRTGTHILWYRAGADSGTDDSGWFHLDGDRPSTRTNGNEASMSGFNGAVWEWNSAPQDGPAPMTFEISEPGVHTIAVARREDGAFFDKFIITVDPNFDPTTFGELGPPVTLREGEPVPVGDAAEITLHPADTEGIENTPLSIDAVVTIPDGKLASLQWQRQEGNNFVAIPGATLPTLTIDPLTMDWNGAVVRLEATVSGNAVATDSATISVIPETVAPVVLSADGIAPAQRVTLFFSEPLDEDSANDPGNYTVSSNNDDLNVTGATLLSNGITVILETSTQRVGTKYTVTVNGVNDTAATPNPVVNGQARFYSLGELLPQGDDGLIVFEAEDYTANPDELWIEDYSRGRPSGSISMVNPNGVGGSESATKLEYDLEFTHTGTHIIWYRASSESGNDDSAWLHVDGERPFDRVDGNLASMSGFSSQADFIWVSDPQEGPSPMTFEIDTLGTHTIGLARREDGAFFDKFVITIDPNFDPNSFGELGPPVTRLGAPPLPSITLTAPLDGAALPAGEDIQLTVDIEDSGRTISRVEYRDGQNLIGEVTEAPFNLLWENVPDGAYFIRALLFDDVGASVGTEVHSVLVGDPNDLLFVVGNPDLAAAPGDQAVAARLEALGYRVVVVDDAVSQTGDSFGKKAVIVSSTVSSGSVNNKFRNIVLPVLIWEQANQDDFEMTTDDDGITRGSTGEQTSINLVDFGFGDELTDGLPAGSLTIADSPVTLNWGLPNENAFIAATIEGNPDQAVLYGYEQGQEMIDGFIAPERRVMIFMTDDGTTALNEAGKRLFDTALAWALNIAPVSPPSVPEPTGGDITVNIEVTPNGRLIVSWEGGTGPFRVETTENLSGAGWSEITTTSDRSVTLPNPGTSGFYRVAGQ